MKDVFGSLFSHCISILPSVASSSTPFPDEPIVCFQLSLREETLLPSTKLHCIVGKSLLNSTFHLSCYLV